MEAVHERPGPVEPSRADPEEGRLGANRSCAFGK